MKINIKSLLENYLTTYKNIDTSKAFNCLNPNHDDKNPSMHFYKEKNHCKCFSCGAYYSIIDLVMIDNNFNDPKDAINKICEIYNLNKHDITTDDEGENIENIELEPGIKPENLRVEPDKNAKDNIFKAYKNIYKKLKIYDSNKKNYEMTDNRKISTSVLNLLHIKEDKDNIIIPTTKGIAFSKSDEEILNNIDDLTIRRINPKDDASRYLHLSNTGKATIYDPLNVLKRDKKRNIILTEGEIDCISCLDLLLNYSNFKGDKLIFNGYYTSAIALCSVNNIKLFIEDIKNLENKDNLNFTLYLDNDKAGEQAREQIEDALNEMQINYVICNINGNLYKDANEYFKADFQGFKENMLNCIENYENALKKAKELKLIQKEEEIKEKREQYINNNSNLSKLNNFITTRNEFKANIIKTYFLKLDELLKGGLRPGLITIGAMSSIGKTSLMLQIADQIAMTNQRPVLYINYEMSTNEMIAKSLSRLMYIESTGTKAISYANILDNTKLKDEEKNIFETAFNDYKSYCDNLFMVESEGNQTLDDVEKKAQEIKEHTGKAPIIFIDYLQIIPTLNDKLSDKQKIDTNILRLKQLSRKYNTPVVVVCSLNRQSYNLNVAMESFKESGAIEYSSDVLIGLNFCLNQEQENKIKEINKDTSLNETMKKNKIDEIMKEIKGQTIRKIQLDILKNRNGEWNKSIILKFNPKANIFMEESETDQIGLQQEIIDFSNDNKQKQNIYEFLPF